MCKIEKMTRYSIEPRDCIFVKGYAIFSFAKNISKNISKSVKNVSGKYCQKFLDHAKQSATDSLKTNLKRVIELLI